MENGNSDRLLRLLTFHGECEATSLDMPIRVFCCCECVRIPVAMSIGIDEMTQRTDISVCYADRH
jgi:hypothetical protein